MIPPGTGDNCTGHCLAWDRALATKWITRLQFPRASSFAKNSAWVLWKSGNDGSRGRKYRCALTACLKQVGSCHGGM